MHTVPGIQYLKRIENPSKRALFFLIVNRQTADLLVLYNLLSR